MADDARLDRVARALMTNDGWPDGMHQMLGEAGVPRWSTYQQRAREWLRMFDAAQRRPEDG